MYIIYNVESGAIDRLLECPQEWLSVNISEGERCVAYDNEVPPGDIIHSHFIHEGQLLEKADYTLSELPIPCTVTIEGVEYHCTEQPTFEFDAPGTYIIQVDAGPRYLRKEFTIEDPA